MNYSVKARQPAMKGNAMIQIGEDSTGDPRDIEAIVTTLRNAGHALERRDPDVVIAMFDKNDMTTSFDFLAPGLTTVEEICRNSAEIAEGATGEVICRYPKVTVRILSPDVAFLIAYEEIDVTAKDGNRMNVHVRLTGIWQRIDGKWACVHKHSSLPVDVATGKAELKQLI